MYEPAIARVMKDIEAKLLDLELRGEITRLNLSILTPKERLKVLHYLYFERR
jgi:hypothetical protein